MTASIQRGMASPSLEAERAAASGSYGFSVRHRWPRQQQGEDKVSCLRSKTWWESGQGVEGERKRSPKWQPVFYCGQIGDGGTFRELGNAGATDLREERWSQSGTMRDRGGFGSSKWRCPASTGWQIVLEPGLGWRQISGLAAFRWHLKLWRYINLLGRQDSVRGEGDPSRIGGCHGLLIPGLKHLEGKKTISFLKFSLNI